MEILDALERKVTQLLTEIVVLQKRNAELEAINSNPAGRDENAKVAELESALEKERKLREAALSRVSTLVRHLEEHNGTS